MHGEENVMKHANDDWKIFQKSIHHRYHHTAAVNFRDMKIVCLRFFLSLRPNGIPDAHVHRGEG